jgi:hypothetical protein
MERADWMNERVREEIESLQRTYGFEEDEAVAYWHLRDAGHLIRVCLTDRRACVSFCS